MNITIDRTALQRVLKHLVRFVPTHLGTRPIQKFVHIDVNGESAKFTVNNLCGGITTTLWDRGFGDDNPLTITEPGVVLLEARLLQEIVKKFDGKDVRIELRGVQAAISCAKAIYQVASPLVKEFVSWGTPGEDASTVEIDARALRRLVESVAYATAKSESRPILTGVQLVVSQECVLAHATDSYRLAMSSVPTRALIQGSVTETLLPAGALTELVAALPDDDDEIVRWTVGDTLSRFTWNDGDMSVSVRPIEGPFPDLHRIVPTVFGTVVSLPRADLLALTERVMPVCGHTENQRAEFSFEHQCLHVMSCAPQVGQVEDSLDIETVPTVYRAHINVRFLAEALRAIACETVHLHLPDQRKGVWLITGDEAYTRALLMTIHPNGASTNSASA